MDINTAPNHPTIARGFGCPHCGGDIERVARRWPDRLLSLWIPVRRYRCRSAACGWLGLLQRRRDIGVGVGDTQPPSSR